MVGVPMLRPESFSRSFPKKQYAQIRKSDVIKHTEDDVWGGEANYLLLAMDGPTTFEGTIPYDEDFLGAVQWD